MYTCDIQSFKILASFSAEQAGLNLTWSKITEDTVSRDVAHIGRTMAAYSFGRGWQLYLVNENILHYLIITSS